MLDVWQHDLESLEAVAQDETTRLLCLRMAAMSQAGTLEPFLDDIDRDGETIRHFWGSELFYASSDPGQDPRHVGTLEPVWNLFDLTREGRGTDWDEQLSYP